MKIIFGILFCLSAGFASSQTINIIPSEKVKKDSLKLNNHKMDDVKFVNIVNAKIAYKEFGSGEPLIMCVGYGANMDLWSTGVIDMLKEKYRVIVFDYRGMGLSTNTDSSFTINTLADDLNELMNVLGIKRASILGWSMGGFVVQMFAINHTDKVNKLVLYASNCGGSKTINPSEEIIKILANPSPSPMDLIGTLFPDQWLKENREPWKSLPFPTEPFNTKTIVQQYIAVQQWLSPGNGSAELLNKLNMPVLLICGNEDKVVPYENSSILSELIKSSRLTVIKDSGHGLMYQMPDVFAKNLLSFLCE
jgi:pimeloyl-ACP methyl ester carboxylesterase